MTPTQLELLENLGHDPPSLSYGAASSACPSSRHPSKGIVSTNWPRRLFHRGVKSIAPAWKLASISHMAGFDHQPEGTWDEYDWERFLQQQDHKTEKYMELLEKYLDDPNRDQIIAREMGWTQLLEGRDWTQEVDALLEEDEEDKLPPPDSFEDHKLYRAAFALTVWIDHMFDQDVALQNEPSAVKLATHAALASAKLAAALSGEDVDEIGMTIAYLKRALKAITLSMDAAAALLREKRIPPSQHSVLLQRLFQVRDGIITLIGEYRREWRRRFGGYR